MDKEIFLNLLKERILILDGGMGTMVQGFKLTEKDYRGKQFADWMSDLKGNNDLLCITRPDVIKSIHRSIWMPVPIFLLPTLSMQMLSRWRITACKGR